MSEKLDVFEVLNNINAKNYNYLSSLDDELKKQFTPYVVHNWISSTTDPLQMILLQRFVNCRYFELSNHPELIYKLFCVSATSRNMRYNWIYKKSAKTDAVDIIARYLNCSKKEARLHERFFNVEDINEMINDLGYQPAEVKKLKI
jgi:hypothetical protein